MGTVVICNACGHMMETHDTTSLLITCDKCGRKNRRPAVSGDALEKFKRANELRKQREFQDAIASYKLMLNSAPDDVDGLWGCLLCTYGAHCEVENGRRIWQIHTLEFTSGPLREHGDFKRILELTEGDPERQQQFIEDATAIDQVITEIRRLAMNAKDYDIFLCHKTTGRDKGETVEYHKALRLYRKLTKKGFHVFFAPVELQRTMAGANYEAGIYKALYSARVMLVVCADKEYLHSQWVYSEWSRFVKRIDKDSGLRLVPVLYPPMQPKDLPPEFVNRSLNAVTMNPEKEGMKHLQEMLRPYAPPAKPWRAAVALAIAVVVLAGAAAFYMLNKGEEAPPAATATPAATTPEVVPTAAPATEDYLVREGDTGETAQQAIRALQRLYYLEEGDYESFDRTCQAAYTAFCIDKGLEPDKNISRDAFTLLVSYETEAKSTPMIVAEVATAELSGDGNTRRISVTSNGSWQAVTTHDWIGLSSRSGKGDAELTVTLAKNPSDVESRTGYITFTCGTAVQTVAITQAPRDSISATVDGTGDSRTMRIQANGPWTATTDADWVNMDVSNGTEDATVLITLAANPDTEHPREAQITLTCGTATQTVTIAQAKADRVAATANGGTLPHQGGEASIAVEANGAWTATTDATWLKLSATTGNGNAGIKVTAAANKDTEHTREAQITLTCGTATQTVTIMQAKADRVAATANGGTLPHQGGEASIAVEANGAWTATTDADWVNMDVSNGTEDATVLITLAANPDTEHPREAEITLTCGTATQTVTIAQAKADRVAATANGGTLPHQGGEASIAVEANGAWTATTDATWLKLSATSGNGNVNITATAAANKDTEHTREAQITLTCGTATQTVTIAQAKADRVSATANGGTLPHQGGEASIAVEANGAWTATTDATWLKLSATSGNGNAGIKVTAAANKDTEHTREAQITLTCGTVTQTVTIMQAKADRVSATANGGTLPHQGGEASIAVEANGAWTATTDATWLKLSATSGNGNAGIKVTAAANKDTEHPREAEITLTCGTAVQTVTIMQAKADRVAATANGGTLPHQGGEASIAVEANGAWTATTDATWLKLSATSGNGNANITATAAANPDTEHTREAQITLTCGTATQTVTIAQAKADRVAATANGGTLPHQGGEASIAVEANGAWTATTDATWLKLSAAAGNGNVNITATAAANPDTEHPREAEITLTCGTATQTVTVAQAKADRMTATANGGTLPHQGGEASIAVEANGAWTATTDATWLKLSATSGNGNAGIKVTAAANKDTEHPREAKITLTCGTATQTVTVAQAKADRIEATLSGGSQISSESVTRTITVTANGEWTVEADVDWITVESGGKDSRTIRVSVQENDSISRDRTGSLTFTCGTATDTVTITQEKKDYVSVTSGMESVTAGEQDVSITVKANGSWTATTDVNWITLDAASGLGNATVKATVTANPYTGNTRTGNITITCGTATQTVTITQAKKDNITATPASKSITAGEQDVTIAVKANGPWTATADVSWITLDMDSSDGNATVTVTVSENASTTAARTGTIEFRCGTCTRVVTITQAKADYVSATPGSRAITADEQTVSITVNANGGWTATTDASWIALDTTSGTGNATLKATISANTSTTSARTGRITINRGTASCTVTITQAKADSVSATPTSKSVTAEKQTVSVSVTANGSWSATSDASWIALDKTSGTGNATLKATIAANTDTTSARTGRITINRGTASCTVTITQAKADSVSATPTSKSVTAEKQTVSVSVKANGSWSATSDASWITLDTPSGTGNATLKATISANTSTTNARTGRITINRGTASCTVTITQAKADSVSATPTTKSVTAEKQTVSIPVTANGSWSATSDASWIALDTASGTGNATVKATIAANTDTTSARTGRITINRGTASCTVTITQAKADSVSATPTSKSVTAEKQTVSVSVKANGGWSATSDASWITLDKTSGTGNATVKVTISENSSMTSSRTGYVTFTCGAQTQTVTITQAKKDTPFDVTLSAPRKNRLGRQNSVPVYSGPGTNYYRAANGKAECTVYADFYVWGYDSSTGWYMITYETNGGGNRTGYIKKGTFSGTIDTGVLTFASKAARTTQRVALTDDPYGLETTIFTLNSGTNVTYLGTYVNGQDTWYYIECTANGKKTRGFIPEGTLEVR